MNILFCSCIFGSIFAPQKPTRARQEQVTLQRWSPSSEHTRNNRSNQNVSRFRGLSFEDKHKAIFLEKHWSFLRTYNDLLKQTEMEKGTPEQVEYATLNAWKLWFTMQKKINRMKECCANTHKRYNLDDVLKDDIKLMYDKKTVCYEFIKWNSEIRKKELSMNK